MAHHKSSLFTMDLRIDKEIVKLKVYEQDSLTDLIDRLSSAIKWKSTSKQKIKTKLEDQFRKITQSTDISLNVKTKLDSLLQQSKIIIIAIETDKNDIVLNQTPFKILQESMLHGKKIVDQNIKKNYHYLNNVVPNLHARYQSNQLTQQIRSHQEKIEPKFENIIVRTKNVSPIKYKSHIQTYPKQDSTEIFQKKYQAIDRKCQNFISKNLGSSQNYDYRHSQPYQSNHVNRFANTPIELIQTRQRQYDDINVNGYQQLVRQNQQRIKYQLHCPENPRVLRSRSGSEINFPEKYKNSQTFQQYKINRYKSNNNFHPKQFQAESNQRPITNRQNIRPSKSYTRLNAGNQYNAGTIRNYDNVVEKKLLSGAVSYNKLRGKYNYLSEQTKY